ncbi:DUF305 domain-containing protein [Actinoplanes sp. L3-i22]|uniref:DUF305 domain-containing protein n=1 Tax=Actinoplanes sp. L3-i22 TaxID=2836373 RepID=UPI001C766F77|nr:DUF305 domain-containing protein [Actinoplanes sp. L3-i22]BCY08197.1 DUF305 domain-containing protein [Actinoplanes sp. L3-i22]
MRLIAIAAAALMLAGCAEPTPTAAVATTTATATEPAFGGTDLAWIEVALALDEQLLPLLDAIPAHTATPAVTSLAAQVRTLTDAELPQLRALHDRAGLPADNPHVGMPMPGMVTAEELKTMTALPGTAFDRAALDKLREGITQSIALARGEQDHGADQATRTLAGTVLTTRSALPVG